MMNNEMIRPVCIEDSRRICDIYNHFVQNTSVSFEEVPVSQEDMEKRIETVTSSYPFLVYESKEGVVGYAYANKWKERSAYRFTAEVTVYIHKDHPRKGYGSELLKALLDDLKTRDIHVLIAVIALPNEQSIQLHERFGFKKVAHFTEVGYKQKRWIDVGYWELQLKAVNQ